MADTFSVAAFHLGLMCELTALTDLLSDHIFYEDYGRDYQQLRRRFSAQELDQEALADMLAFSSELLDLASRGLEKRGFGESSYLAPLYQRIKTGENPAQKSLRLFEAGKSLSEISEMFANEKDS